MPGISGTVKVGEEPRSGVYVRLYGPSGEFVAEEYTRDDGAFLFHVVGGTWKLEARAAGVTATEHVQVADSDIVVGLELRAT